MTSRKRPSLDSIEAIIGEQPVVIIRDRSPLTAEEVDLLKRMDEAVAETTTEEQGKHH